MRIAPPKHPADHPDRIIDCEFAMEPSFQAMAEEAIAAGWTEDDVAQGLLNLAAAHIRGLAAERRTASDIRVAKQMIKAMKGDRT
jgi:hypothetical protein